MGWLGSKEFTWDSFKVAEPDLSHGPSLDFFMAYVDLKTASKKTGAGVKALSSLSLHHM